MSSKGHIKNYDFGPKRHWRRWMWNRIVERLAVPPRDAVVLYLAGANDFDRPVALAHGFRPENLIAVEHNRGVAFGLRKNKTLTTNSSFGEASLAVLLGREVHVLLGDFCGDCTNEVVGQFWGALCLLPNAKRAVVAVNFMRGRGILTDSEKVLASMIKDAISDRKESDKHRGWRFFLWLATKDLMVRVEKNLIDGFGSYVALNHSSQMTKEARPAFSTYKSGRIAFDSCVLRNPFRHSQIDPAIFEHVELPDDLEQTLQRLPSLQRSVAAVFAHRTMRSRA